MINTPDISPNLMSFLPMLYVAWADDVLSPSEIELIQQKIQAQSWLSKEEKRILAKWLHPTEPPSPQLLNHWLEQIKHSATNMSEHKRKTLAELGLDMAQIGAEGIPAPCTTPEACHALEEIESALGIIGHEASRGLLAEGKSRISEEKVVASSFDPALLHRLLEADQYELRQKVKHLLSDPVFQLKTMSDKSHYREVVLGWCRRLAEQGLGSISYPESYGGKNDLRAYVAIFETMAYHDLSLLIKFGVHFGLFGLSVLALGTKRHHEKYLPKIGTLELPGCFAMTEEGHGSNVRDIETTATYDAEKEAFIIHTPFEGANKTYIGNAALHGQMATVFAQLYTGGEHYGVHAFLVPIRDDRGKIMPGIRIEDCGEKLGLNGVDNGRIWFKEVHISRENLLNRFGEVSPEGLYSSPIPSASKRFFTMLGTLVGGRVCVSIAGLSATKKALALAIRYAAQRRQFGRENEVETLILDYQTHQRKLLIPLAKTYALHFAHRYMTDRYVAQSATDGREIESLAAGLKAISTWHTTHTIQTCREACGGNGYLADNHFASLKADTDVFTTFEGDNTVLLQLVAKSRLSAFKQLFHDSKFFGLLRYIVEQAATAIIELNPISTRQSDSEHLRDPDFHRSAFQYREQVSLSAVARRLKKRIDKRMDAYEAFMETQQHLVEMAEAYIDHVILTQFQTAIAACQEVSLQAILQKLCTLYALSTIEQHRAWFLEYGYIEGKKSKAIQREVNLLCKELRPDALALVEAFAIPAHFMRASMLLG